MQSGPPYIGFEKILSDTNDSYVGFEQYQTRTQNQPTPAYPLSMFLNKLGILILFFFFYLIDDTMPNPNQYSSDNLLPSLTQSRSSYSKSLRSSDLFPKNERKSSLPFPQLFAIYNEIFNEWSQEQWLVFVDNQKETYLTLDFKTHEPLTVQKAIDHYYLKSGTRLLLSQPECLLIRTSSSSKTLFLPNTFISIDNLLDNHDDEESFQYKLLAIICDSAETSSKIMFYRDKHTGFWHIFYNQSISSPSSSDTLSDEEQIIIESFVQPKNQMNSIDISQFTYPLSTLFHHPILYVYIPKANLQKP